MRPCGPADTRRVCRRGKRVECKRVTRLMRVHGIQAHRRRPFRKTTDSKHTLPLPRLAGPAVRARAEPGQGKARTPPGLAGMTDIATGEGWLHLAAIMDLLSPRVVGWAMSEIP